MALDQRTRLVVLVAEFGLLVGANALAFGTLAPPEGPKGFWFYVALLGLLLGRHLDTPHFVKPSDVILYSAPAFVSLMLASLWATWNAAERLAFLLTASYCVVAALLAAIAILGKDSRRKEALRAAGTAKVLAERLGAPVPVFSVVLVFAVYAFHRSSAREALWILIGWVAIGPTSPVAGAVAAGRKISKLWGGDLPLTAAGELVRYEMPGLVVVRRNSRTALGVGDLFAIRSRNEGDAVALGLGGAGRDEGALLKGVVLCDGAELLGAIEGLSELEDGTVAKLEPAFAENMLGIDISRFGTVVGAVAPGSTSEQLRFEVFRAEQLSEGRLVEVEINGVPVIFQVTKGETAEEVIQGRNSLGYELGIAQKIGQWSKERERFLPVGWVPAPNTPVFIRSRAAHLPSARAIGHFPGTDLPATISSVSDLVTHNTAILGVLGVGKSMLAIELVERMVRTGIKVVVVDLTNQYAGELGEYYAADTEAAKIAAIVTAGERDQERWAENPEDGGSIQNLRAALRADLEEFLAAENEQLLKIYNPAQIGATKQLNEPRSFQAHGRWERGAALWSVTPVEVTRLVAETILSLVQGDMRETARVCLVLEEAHSLIPEMNAVASDADRIASMGTARAILQGRKFGYGCLVITQRAANVTKTVLNQCNTVFAFRIFDQNGKEFLANYVGRGYAESLSSIEARHAVFFGKASSCDNPILVRLNDRGDFTRVFRVGAGS